MIPPAHRRIVAEGVPSRSNASAQHFRKFDQIAERIAKEGELTTDGGQDEGLGDDLDAPAAKLDEGLVHVRNVETEVVVAAVLEAVAKIGVRSHLSGQRVPAAEHL